MAKFKIDLKPHTSSFPFVLFVWREGWLTGRWEDVYSFETREQAKAFHAKIKDLPEYL